MYPAILRSNTYLFNTFIYTTCTHVPSYHQSPKFKRVSLNETPEFPFWGLGNCVNFDLRNFKK